MKILQGEVLIFKALSDDYEHDEDPYVMQLLDLRFRPKVIPVLDFEYCNLKTLHDHLHNPLKFTGIIFTSPRAVRAAALSLGPLGSVLSGWHDKVVYVVGEQTRRAVERELDLETVGSDTGSASSLADFILQRTCMQTLLYPCGSLRHDTLHTKLTEGRIALSTVPVYQTKAHPNLEQNIIEATAQGSQVAEFLVYFSPSGVRFSLPVLNKLCLPLEKIKIVAIGPTTAAALGEAQLHVWSQACKASPEFLAKAVMEEGLRNSGYPEIKQ